MLFIYSWVVVGGSRRHFSGTLTYEHKLAKLEKETLLQKSYEFILTSGRTFGCFYTQSSYIPIIAIKILMRITFVTL